MRIGGSSGGGGGRFERPSAGERLFEGRMPNPIVGIAGLHGEGPRAAAVDSFGGRVRDSRPAPARPDPVRARIPPTARWLGVGSVLRLHAPRGRVWTPSTTR